eukprot:14916427-Alexandrium_andersonii.AAC.1
MDPSIMVPDLAREMGRTPFIMDKCVSVREAADKEPLATRQEKFISDYPSSQAALRKGRVGRALGPELSDFVSEALLQ